MLHNDPPNYCRIADRGVLQACSELADWATKQRHAKNDYLGIVRVQEWLADLAFFLHALVLWLWIGFVVLWTHYEVTTWAAGISLAMFFSYTLMALCIRIYIRTTRGRWSVPRAFRDQLWADLYLTDSGNIVTGRWCAAVSFPIIACILGVVHMVDTTFAIRDTPSFMAVFAYMGLISALSYRALCAIRKSVSA